MLPLYYFYWFRIDNKHMTEPWLDQALMDLSYMSVPFWRPLRIIPLENSDDLNDFFYIISNNIIISDLMFGKREDEGIPLYSLQQAEMNIYIYIVKFIYALRLELFLIS